VTASEPATWRFDAIGTAWEVVTDGPLDEAVRRETAAIIERFDAAWSRFRPDSLVSRLARHGGRVPAPSDAAPLLDTLAEVATVTGDAVNPLVGGSLEQLGYGAAYTLRAGAPVAAPSDWRAALSWSADELALERPATIDVGALGKGRLVDLVLGALPPGDAVVDAGGDIAVRGQPVRIGLEHPYDSRRAIGVWEITDAALCASAVNRRAWGDGLHHVLDARTGEPVRAVAATWAVADDAMHADALATALFFESGPEVAARWRGTWNTQWVRMLTDGRVEWSPGCDAQLFGGR
jgi:thiamine biosynthesis lipoprotein